MIGAENVGDYLQMAIAIMAFLIALISLHGYLVVRSRTSLIVAIAFFLLALPPSLYILEAFGLYQFPVRSSYEYDYVIEMIRLMDLIALCQVAAFSILGLMYLDPYKNRDLVTTRAQKWFLFLAIVAATAFGIYLMQYSYGIFGHPVWPFLASYLSIVLILIFMTLMYSFYRARRDRNTLLGITGFMLILFNVAYSMLSFDYLLWNDINSSTGGWALTSVLAFSMIGYAVFLIAIIRARFFDG